jgi:hypothetical protein
MTFVTGVLGTVRGKTAATGRTLFAAGCRRDHSAGRVAFERLGIQEIPVKNQRKQNPAFHFSQAIKYWRLVKLAIEPRGLCRAGDAEAKFRHA